MTFTPRAFHIACLACLAVSAPLSRTGLAAGNAASTTTIAGASSLSMPVVAQHKYRMLARVRPLLFWISKDDVGGARISWHGDGNGGFGVDLLIGSDPQRAPRQINRWGYIAEAVRGTDAHVIGVMKQSNEQTVAEAEKQIGSEGQGGYIYRAIQGTSTAGNARAEVTTVHVERDLTFRDIDPLLDLVSGPNAKSQDGQARSVGMPSGTRPGFLVALHELLTQSAAAYAAQPNGSFRPSRTPTPYVYYGVFYDLTMKSAEFLKTATIDGHKYTNLARSDFEMRNRSNGETTKFQLTYGTAGPLSGVPVHAVYQARWWFEVQLFLDDNTNF